MKQDILQKEFSEKYIEGPQKTCFNISVRFGKTRMAILILQKLKVENILILYPEVNIKKAWEEEFEKMEWIPSNVTYSTYLSVKKNTGVYDFVIADEIQKASENALYNIKNLLNINNKFIGLSGTYSQKTIEELKYICNLEISETYDTEEAIDDNIIANYNIIIKNYHVNNTDSYLKTTKYKKWLTTEKQELNRLSHRVKTSSGMQLKFAALARMRWINSCNSLLKEVKNLLIDLKDNRYILYGADIKFVDSLGISTYHSENKKLNNLSLFLEKKIDKLALIQLATAGITFPNLDTVVITNINSNSENLFQKLGRSLLLEKNKISNIYIFCSYEQFQRKWLEKALIDVPQNKIKNVYEN